MSLFEVAILQVPTKKEIEEGTGEEKLVFGPTFVTAKDGQSAAIKAVLGNADKTASINQDRMQVLVRPFA
jgi:hypothetical protein